MIGVTGATGTLGKAILAAYPDVTVPIYRTLPEEGLPVIIHTATILPGSGKDPSEFDSFNHSLASYVNQHKTKIVNVGTCWQILEGSCQEQPYTLMKNRQEALLPDAIHVYAYNIFGPQSGFIFNLKRHLNGEHKLSHVHQEPRDFIYVGDVARACMSAVGLEPGRYAIASGKSTLPANLIAQYDIDLPVIPDRVTARLAYPLPVIGNSLVTINDFMGAPAIYSHPINDLDFSQMKKEFNSSSYYEGFEAGKNQGVEDYRIRLRNVLERLEKLYNDADSPISANVVESIIYVMDEFDRKE
jgi:hypothetical protein